MPIMTPSKTFKLKKQTKRLMATLISSVSRNVFKGAMIQAQLASEVRPPKEKRTASGLAEA